MSTTAMHGGELRTCTVTAQREADVRSVIRKVRIAYIRELVERGEYVRDVMIDVTADRILRTWALGNEGAAAGRVVEVGESLTSADQWRKRKPFRTSRT